ncbi:hypothetical protein P152DRAFT_457348 [Eremomyces bilateralis CBS 781.70]|uniref:CFEM domain-containing protein n=1 Tax=Eremomyces bilateralis CBS 781.70 TaxID=1392243 RepID=A0A6G1G7Z6_9PEZI|nr:uncharacterized protein P152DRAFT_457348 [Eremomyces bilateralis CBS 781.70]KAF1813979.1 hypothetical protein P152DRAFT_457348 [Eremomyces bilateralis CBS 781.70]
MQKCWAEAKGNSSCASGNDICLCNDSNFGYDLGWCAGMECNSADIGATIDFLYPFCSMWSASCRWILGNADSDAKLPLSVALAVVDYFPPEPLPDR